MSEKVTFKNWGIMYAMWRFTVWSEVGTLTYQEIDDAVKDGIIQPGDSMEKVRDALQGGDDEASDD